MSQPPDSPPTRFDSLPTIDGPTLDSPDSSPRSTRTTTGAATGYIPFPSPPRPHHSHSQSSSSSISSPIPVSARARTLSARARLIEIGFAATAQEAPPLNSQWLQSKSREELEALLTEADRVIRERTRDLEAAASVGKYLLDENNSLRTRHDSIAARSPIKTRADKPQISPAGRPWRSSLSFPAPAGQSTSRRAPRPSLYQTADSSDHDDGRGPSTPTRHRTISSTTSIASLFAASPRTASVQPDPASQLATLDQANYVLHLQLTELEQDAETQERTGKKKLKKLEKEILALRDELGRAEQRNGILESEVEASQLSHSTNNSHSRAGSGRPVKPRTSDGSASSEPSDSPIKPQPMLDHDSDNGAPVVAPSEASSSDTSLSAATAALLDPTYRRAPGNGSRSAEPSLRMKQAPRSPDEQQDALVSQLVAKIDELRDENDSIKEQRVELVERWDQAQRDLDEYRQRCDELEEIVDLEWGSHQQGVIGWTDTSDDSQKNLKGNQRSIRSRNQRSVSFSSRSFRERSASPSPKSRRRRPTDVGRTLGSELGSHWDGDSDGRIGEDTEDEERASSASTSTPLKHRSTSHMDLLINRDATLDDLIPPGSLRFSGPPDSMTYERISQAVAEAPVVWEKEVGETQQPAPRSRRGLLSSLNWGAKGEEDDEWDASKYPEPDESDTPGGPMLLESRESVEEREGADESRHWSEIRRRRYRRKGTEAPRSSRRDRALLRLGLPEEYGLESSSQDEASPTRSSGSVIDREDADDEDSSEFEYLHSSDHKERGDYYPVSLRARYAPRVMVSWAADSAIRQVVNFLLYLKLFVVLGLAVFFAIWQGPKKTMGVVDRRRLH
ncbi:hypothetical protein RQP46_008333 [Phenoliferia psychrophenolica]